MFIKDSSIERCNKKDVSATIVLMYRNVRRNNRSVTSKSKT
ncbi:MAG: hypothetical protein ACP5GU_04680 [Thermoprotei archaeon]